MHGSITLFLWATGALALYKIVLYVSDEIQHYNNARRLGCKPAYAEKEFDPLSIRAIRRFIKADQECRLAAFVQERNERYSEKQKRQISTFSANFMGTPMIFTFEPENIKTLLATQFKDYGIGEARNRHFFPLLGNGIFSTDGKQWEHSRAMLRPQFARAQVSDLELEEVHVQNMMGCLRVNPDGWTETTNMQPLFFHLTMDAATEFLFGESVNSQLSNLPGYPPTAKSFISNSSVTGFASDFDMTQNYIARGMLLRGLYWLVHNAEFKQACQRCHDLIDHYVQRALDQSKTAPQTHTETGKPKYVFLDALVQDTRDPLILRSELLNILLAGRDTTASLLSYIFIMLIQYPAVFTKLRQTLIDEFGTYTNPKKISFAGLKSCTYLQWVLNETLRLFPIIPINSRCALVNTTLPTGGGPDGQSPVYVRKGTEIEYNVWMMHRRKDIWGPDANEFRPERWDGWRSGWEYLPFNGGPRICIGQQFALTETGYVVTRLLQRFDKLEGTGNSWEAVDKGGYGFMRHRLNLTSAPADGVKVRLREARE